MDWIGRIKCKLDEADAPGRGGVSQMLGMVERGGRWHEEDFLGGG